MIQTPIIKYILTLVLCLFMHFVALQNSKAQLQGNLVQYMYDHSIINPAARASYADFSASLFTRKQWVGVKGSPQLNALNLTLPFSKVSTGLSMYQQSVGPHKSYRLYASYAYQLRIGYYQYINFGIGAGMFYENSQFANLSTSSGQDPNFQDNYSSGIQPDFQLGVFYYHSGFYLGLAVPSILKSELEVEDGTPDYKTKLYDQRLHLFVQGGYTRALSFDWSWQISFLTRYIAQHRIKTDINTQLLYLNRIGFGVSYRTPNEYLALLNYWLTKNIRVGYAYQNSQIKNNRLHSHELMLFYTLTTKRNRRVKFQRSHF